MYQHSTTYHRYTNLPPDRYTNILPDITDRPTSSRHYRHTNLPPDITDTPSFHQIPQRYSNILPVTKDTPIIHHIIQITKVPTDTTQIHQYSTRHNSDSTNFYKTPLLIYQHTPRHPNKPVLCQETKVIQRIHEYHRCPSLPL